MEDDYSAQSPNVYIGFSDLSSDEYNKEQLKHSFKPKFKETHKRHFTSKAVHSLKQKRKSRKEFLSDFLNEMNPFISQLNMPITKKPSIVKQRQQETLLAQLKQFIAICPQFSYCFDTVSSNLSKASEVLKCLQEKGGIEATVANGSFDEFMFDHPSLFTSIEELKAFYDEHLASIEKYIQLKQLNYTDSTIKDIIDSTRHRTKSIKVTKRLHLGIDSELMISTAFHSKEPIVAYSDSLDFNELASCSNRMKGNLNQRITLGNSLHDNKQHQSEDMTLNDYYSDHAYRRLYPLSFGINQIEHRQTHISMNLHFPSKMQFDSQHNILSYSKAQDNRFNRLKVKIIDQEAEYTLMPTNVFMRKVVINISQGEISHWIVPSSQYEKLISLLKSKHSFLLKSMVTPEQLMDKGISFYPINQKQNEVLILPVKSLHWYQVKDTASLLTYNLLPIEDLIEVFEEYNHFKSSKVIYPFPLLFIILSFINEQLFSLSLDIAKYFHRQLTLIADEEGAFLKEVLKALSFNEVTVFHQRVEVGRKQSNCDECKAEFFNYHIEHYQSDWTKRYSCLCCFGKKIRRSVISIGVNVKLCNRFSDGDVELLMRRIQFKNVNHYNIRDSSASFQFNLALTKQYEEYKKPQEAFSQRKASPSISSELNYLQFLNEEEAMPADFISKSLIPLVDAEVFSIKINQPSPLSYNRLSSSSQCYIDYDTLLYQSNVLMFSPHPYEVRSPTPIKKHSKGKLRQLLPKPSTKGHKLHVKSKDNELFQLKESSTSANSSRFPGKHLFDFIQSKEEDYEDHAYRAMFNMSYVDNMLIKEKDKQNEVIRKQLDEGMKLLSSLSCKDEECLGLAIEMIAQAFAYPHFVKQKGLVAFLKEVLSSSMMTEQMRLRIKNELVDPIDYPLYY